MAIKIYDNLLKEEIELNLDPHKDKLWYICGPTVYDSSHLGHARTYLTSDIIRRIMTDYFNQPITYIMNITNIDDKIIARARETKQTSQKLAETFENNFFFDMKSLNIRDPDVVTRVTDFIPSMIHFIEKLIEQKKAYQSNGSVYFSIDNALEIPPLAPKNQNIKKPSDQIKKIQIEKKDPADFALWKQVDLTKQEKEQEKEPYWDSPWGPGRPGWHLECSTMAIEVSKSLGQNGQIDIHGGGIDLAFPHHQNEILQSEGFLGKHWRPVFLHIGHLNILGLKMSKSLKNFITIENFLKSNDPNVLRMLFIQHAYDRPMDFDPEKSIEYAQNSVIRINNYLKHMANFILQNSSYNSPITNPNLLNQNNIDHSQYITDLKKAFDQALRNNFDTNTAIHLILEGIDLVFELTKKPVNYFYIRQLDDWIRSILLMFGFTFDLLLDKPIENKEDEYLKLILDIRNQIRKLAKEEKNQKLFTLSDEIRDIKLKELGVDLQDLQ